MEEAWIEQLLRDGRLTAQELESAREQQKSRGGSLSRHLVDQGSVRRGDLMVATAKALQIPPAPLSRLLKPDLSLVDEIPRRTLVRLCAVPFMRRGPSLCIAIGRAERKEEVRALNPKSGAPIELFAAVESDVQDAIESLCGPEPTEVGPFRAAGAFVSDAAPLFIPRDEPPEAPQPDSTRTETFDPFADLGDSLPRKGGTLLIPGEFFGQTEQAGATTAGVVRAPVPVSVADPFESALADAAHAPETLGGPSATEKSAAVAASPPESPMQQPMTGDAAGDFASNRTAEADTSVDPFADAPPPLGARGQTVLEEMKPRPDAGAAESELEHESISPDRSALLDEPSPTVRVSFASLEAESKPAVAISTVVDRPSPEPVEVPAVTVRVVPEALSPVGQVENSTAGDATASEAVSTVSLHRSLVSAPEPAPSALPRTGGRPVEATPAATVAADPFADAPPVTPNRGETVLLEREPAKAEPFASPSPRRYSPDAVVPPQPEPERGLVRLDSAELSSEPDFVEPGKDTSLFAEPGALLSADDDFLGFQTAPAVERSTTGNAPQKVPTEIATVVTEGGAPQPIAAQPIALDLVVVEGGSAAPHDVDAVWAETGSAAGFEPPREREVTVEWREPPAGTSEDAPSSGEPLQREVTVQWTPPADAEPRGPPPVVGKAAQSAKPQPAAPTDFLKQPTKPLELPQEAEADLPEAEVVPDDAEGETPSARHAAPTPKPTWEQERTAERRAKPTTPSPRPRKTEISYTELRTVQGVPRIEIDGSRMATAPGMLIPEEPVTVDNPLPAVAAHASSSPEPVTDEIAIDIAESSAVHSLTGLGIPQRQSAPITPALAYTAQVQAEIQRAKATGADRETTNIYALDKLAKGEAQAAVADLENDVRRRIDSALNEGDVSQALLRYFGDLFGRVILLERNGDRLIGIKGRLLVWPAHRMHDLDFPVEVFPRRPVEWMAIPSTPVMAKLADALGHVPGVLVTTISPHKGKAWVVCAESGPLNSPPRAVVQLCASAADALSRVRF
jgi:hypothetical protein